MGKFRTTSNKPSGAKYQANRETLQQRSRYIDHSLDFLNWVNTLGLEKTWMGRWVQKLDEKFRLRRLSLLFLYSLVLSFLLFYEFDFAYNMKAGDVLKYNLKSPISFEMVDEVATEERRVAAERAVPTIFNYDRNAYEQLYSRIYSSFRKMRDASRKVKWARDVYQREEQIREFFKFKPMLEAELDQVISDREFEWLALNRFNPKIENMLIEALETWSQYKIVDGLEKYVSPQVKEISILDAPKGAASRELLVQVKDLHDINREDDFSVERVTGIRTLSVNDKRLFTELAQSLLQPNVVPNQEETARRKNKAREEILSEVISIKRNQVLVPEGTPIKPVHVVLLREIEDKRSHRNRNFIALMAATLLVVLLLVFFSYLRRFTLNKIRIEPKDLSVMAVVTLIVVVITKGFLFLTNAAFMSKFGALLPENAFLYAAPVAAGTMLVGLLMTSGEVVWIFSLFLAIVLGLMTEMKFPFILVTLVGGLAAARGVYACKKRNDIYWAGARTGLINALMIALVLTVTSFGDPTYLQQLVWCVPAGLLSGILSSLVAMMLIPALETAFNCTTDVKLLELSNLNHPLLKEMIVRAPGTYHHSLVVGSMVEAAAEEIGANSLLAKVMSYYHDIGKTEHAAYFIENQKPGQNPHDHLSPHMSKTILIAHVKDGLELGLEHKLGKPIIDGIVQHHGTTLISFFYNRALESQDEAMGSVSEEDFRYPGPKPQFREAALIMLADSIEAAARSLDEPTPMRLQNIVKNIIQRKFMDGQLDECNMTLRELSVIEESFIRVLLGIYHQRIDYPKKAGGGASEAPSPLRLNPKKGSVTA